MESKTWHNRLGITGTKTDLPAGDRAKPGVGDVPDELYKKRGLNIDVTEQGKSFPYSISPYNLFVSGQIEQ